MTVLHENTTFFFIFPFFKTFKEGVVPPYPYGAALNSIQTTAVHYFIALDIP